MPTYHYVCEKCGHEFELFQSITAEPLDSCPKQHCQRKTWGRGRVKRVLSGGAGLIFKGQGFYTTDYRSEGYKQAAKKDSEAAKPKSDSGSSGGKSGSDAGKSKASTTPTTKSS
ncbi:MAG: zinc ribbon domain-containing protein [Verrucomicrobiales bacterium]|nr:zinc ribbon domain-containing protein [Verrucomicrobiales bacterium]MCP5527517.1 zinc ribbon domain-containing protein [Verrucomicrobiales bacterium]